MNAKATINPREALFGFMGWLTSRNEVVVLSAHHDAAEIARLITTWADHNNLEPVRDDYYPKNIEHPILKKD